MDPPGQRITVVNPWIPGGEGQLRDLFPLPPALFLTLKALGWLVRHYEITLVTALAFYLWWGAHWGWFGALVIVPILYLSARLILRLLYLWWRNPSIPLIARR